MSVENVKAALRQVEKKIKKACRKAGRDPNEVKIVIVTRNHRVPEIREVIQAGCRCFGENRVQEALQKISFFEPDIEWHLVGHLQSVKAKAAVKAFSLIHTVDRLRNGFDLQRACEKLNREIDVLIQVNVLDGNPQFGVPPDESFSLIRELVKFPLMHIKGLMTQFPPFDEAEESRSCYRKLRELRDKIRDMAIEGVDLKWLSMGGSWDYWVAVEEGANLLRISHPVFEEEK